MPIRVVLLSKDEALAQSCREVLDELIGTEWIFARSVSNESGRDGDVCIWDFIPDETELLALSPDRLQSHLFLLHRQDLEVLRELVGTSNVKALLKPVTHATLKAFLGETCRQWTDRYETSTIPTGTLRAERDEMLQCLIQANVKLQEYDQDRTNFLARSVHDFRAPLTAISGYCELLLEEQMGAVTSEQREVLERMQRSAKRLSRTATAMFQLSTAQKAEQNSDFGQEDIRDCILQALHEVTPAAENKGIAITVDIEPPPGLLFFEKSQLRQVLVNFLDNACKFTPRAGTIQIKGHPFFWERRIRQMEQLDTSRERRISHLKTPNCFRVDIRDSGPVIPAVDLDRIFEEYTSYAGRHDRSGGGLSLAICKMIVNRHQGRVWAESDPTGTSFSFVLPFRQRECVSMPTIEDSHGAS